MMGTKVRLFTPVPTVSLEDLVPADHFYRHLDRVLDLGFARDLVKDCYTRAGRPSIDPIVFFKLQLVMFFEGLRSERQLLRLAADRLSVRWYLGFNLDEQLPDHSSLTRIRTRYGLEVFRRFFAAVVEQCQQAGLDLAGYKVYYGTSPGSYPNSVDIGNLTQATLAGACDCTNWNVAVKAYDAAGRSSARAIERDLGLGSPGRGTTSPSPPSAGRTLNLTITGSNFRSGATVKFGNTGITVNSVTVSSCTQIVAGVTVELAAPRSHERGRRQPRHHLRQRREPVHGPGGCPAARRVDEPARRSDRRQRGRPSDRDFQRGGSARPRSRRRPFGCSTRRRTRWPRPRLPSLSGSISATIAGREPGAGSDLPHPGRGRCRRVKDAANNAMAVAFPRRRAGLPDRGSSNGPVILRRRLEPGRLDDGTRHLDDERGRGRSYSPQVRSVRLPAERARHDGRDVPCGRSLGPRSCHNYEYYVQSSDAERVTARHRRQT